MLLSICFWADRLARHSHAYACQCYCAAVLQHNSVRCFQGE